MARLGSWIEPFPEGIYVKPADAWVDPVAAQGHARWSPTAMPTMRAAAMARCGRRPRRWRSWACATASRTANPVAYGESVTRRRGRGQLRPRRPCAGIGADRPRLSAASGWWCRATTSAAPTRPARRSWSVPCDIFITEATFGLPVFRHPDTGSEIDRLLHRLHARARALRAGRRLCAGQGAAGDRRAARARASTSRSIIMARWSGCAVCTRSLACRSASCGRWRGRRRRSWRAGSSSARRRALNDRWSRRLPDPVTAMASGWMRIRQRARQKQCRAAAGHFRPCRLGRTDAHDPRGRAQGSVDHPRPRGCADALVHDPPDQGARAQPGRL